MMTNKDDVISMLNNLIETCKDGEEGFRNASQAAKDPELKQLFNTYAGQRAGFVTELQSEVRRLGGDPNKMGSVAGWLHRGWVNLKSAVTGQDEGAIVSECERGEDSAVRNYEEALRSGLPDDVRPIVERQYAQVHEAHDRVRMLEKTFSKT